MSVVIAKGTITQPGAIGLQTTTPSGNGPGFSAGEPIRAILIWGVPRAAAGAADGGNAFSFGFGTKDGGAVQQAYVTGFSLDAATTSDTARGSNTTDILKLYSAGTPTVDCEVAVNDITSTTFVLDWQNLHTTASIVLHYMAIGGSSITAARAGSISHASDQTADLDVTVAASWGQPQLILIGSHFVSFADATGNLNMMLGAGKSDTERYCHAFVDQDAQNIMACGSWQKQRFGLQLSGVTGQTEVDLAVLANWPVDGFRMTFPVNTAGAGGTKTWVYLALKGTFTSAINVGTAPTAGGLPVTQNLALGSTPRGALFWGSGLPSIATVDTTHADLGRFALYGMDGTNEGGAQLTQNDGDGTASVGVVHNVDKSLQHHTAPVSGANAPVIQSEADGSFSGTDVVLSWNDIDSIAREYIYVLIGESGANVYQKAGSLTSASFAAGDDVSAFSELGSVSPDTTFAGGDASTFSEAGSLVPKALLAGVKAGTASKTGSLIPLALLAGVPAFVANLAGSVRPDTTLAGVSAKSSAGKTGSLLAGTQLRGADVSAFSEAGAIIAAAFLSGIDASTFAETGALLPDALVGGVSARVIGGKTGALLASVLISGADSSQRAETAALLAGTLLGGADASTFVEAGSLRAFALMSGADVSERAETGAIIAGVLVSGADVYQVSETGLLAAAVRPFAADAATFVETGATTTRAILAGVGTKAGTSTGSLIAGVLLTGADIRTAVETGALITQALMSGPDVSQFTETGFLASAVRLSGADVSTFTEAGSLLRQAILAGIKIRDIPNKPGSLLTAARPSGARITEKAPKSGSLTALARATGFDVSERVETGSLAVGTSVTGPDIYTAVEFGSLLVGTLIEGTATRPFIVKMVLMKGRLVPLKPPEGKLVPSSMKGRILRIGELDD